MIIYQISSLLALGLSIAALLLSGLGVWALIDVLALKRSTHRVQLMPVDKLLEQGNKMFNPSQEELHDWNLPLSDHEDKI